MTARMVVIAARPGPPRSGSHAAGGGLVALGIALPTLWYFASGSVRSWTDRIGLRSITAFHIWRIPAAPALLLVRRSRRAADRLLARDRRRGPHRRLLCRLGGHPGRPDARNYRAVHRFGFVDFVIAVGTELTFTLLLDPRMELIATLPFALIPLFGVGISGASHIVAFDMLRRAGARRWPS